MLIKEITESKKSAKEFKDWLYGHSAYGKWLTDQGFPYPTHDKSGTKYTDVNGKKATWDEDTPYGVITYRPKKSETPFATEKEALANVPKTGDWQVLNMITGEIIKEPEFTE